MRLDSPQATMLRRITLLSSTQRARPRRAARLDPMTFIDQRTDAERSYSDCGAAALQLIDGRQDVG